MNRWAFIAVTIVSGGAVIALRATADETIASSPRAGLSAPAQFLEDTCMKCHNEQASSAMTLFSGLYLDRVDVDKPAEQPIVWEKVIRKLRTGMMPPSSEPRPDPRAVEGFLRHVESSLDAAWAANPDPGRPALHRLNRTEYANAIRDLLAIDVDSASLLPVDDSSFGFDNMAGSLGVSAVLIERYANAAAKIARLAVGNTAISAEQETYYVPNFLMQSEHRDGLPLGTRGGMRVEHYFPVDGEYVVSVGLMSAVNGIHIGNGVPNEQLEIALDGSRVALFDLSPPRPSRRSADESSDGAAEEPSEDDEKEGEKWQLTLPVTAGPHMLTASFIKRNHAPIEDIIQQPANTLIDPLFNGTPEVTLVAHVGSLTIDGPYAIVGPGDTPSRRRIFSCRPLAPSEETTCAREILGTIAHRAYRQAPSAEHLSVVMEFFELGRAEGGFERGIEYGLQRVLASPQFVFRFERQPDDADPAEPFAVGDIELASRLAFFLWSTIPDDELLRLAEAGRLSRPGVLDAQIDRMLADERSRALTDNFAGQWLYLRNLDIKDASIFLYPDFEDRLRAAFRTETELLFSDIVRRDRSVLELFTADYTFVNERLAKHYGMPGIYGDHFRRVPVTEEYRRGVLGHASVLFVTSQPNRTSPVTRGVWVLENVLGAHVPSPPPVNIPSLEEAAGDTRFEELSVRELMELHRARPFCEGCHKIMDPVGLALENFDVIGRWRETEGGVPIDASAHLVDGTEIDGPVELRRAILAYEDQVVRNVAEKLLAYAIGRGAEYFDMPTVRRIARQARTDGYRFSALVKGVVASDQFRMRMPDSSEAVVSHTGAD